MADSTTNRFIASVADAAALAAFVPSPPTPATGPDQGYFVLQRDTNAAYSWDAGSASWVPVGGAGGGLPANVQGDIFYASGTNVVAALAKNASATRYLSNTGGSNNPAWAQVALATGVSGTLPVANGGTGLTSGYPSILMASGTLANAAILALPTTPVSLVAAPGAGFYIQPLMVLLKSDFASGAYTGVSATYSELWAQVGTLFGGVSRTVGLTNDSSTTPVLTQMTVFMGGDSRITALPSGLFATGGYVVPFAPDNGGVLVSDTENKALSLYAWNDAISTNYTGGNAANELKWVAYYTIEAVP